MRLHCARQEATENLARELSLFAKPGQVVLLEGDLGAGKSTFARAFIQALAGRNIDVPSPTFSLIQTYTETRLPVAHADLYRLDKAGDLAELGLEELAQSHVVLIEWPRPETARLSADALHLHFEGGGTARDITLTPNGNWQNIIQRNASLFAFLKAHDIAPETRRFFEGDASSRRYEKAQRRNGQSIIVMDMPRRPDGPPVKNGKPYSAIAHLAEGIGEVVAINDQLCAMGYGAPRIIACDLAQGFALIEDLGDKVYGRLRRDGTDMRAPMYAAVEVLADMAGRMWPRHVKLRGSGVHAIPAYDLAAQLIEVDLLPEWFHLHVHGKPAPLKMRQSFEKIWRKVLHHTQTKNPVWVLRDYHSPNLLWLPERQGLKRVGLIDTQDALLGHPAYDLASLLQDARVDILPAEEEALLVHYAKARGTFDEVEFTRAYAILGAQRATKILGIFARLNYRDGKPQYLAHMPRVSRYLKRNLAHPDLRELKSWFEREMPEALRLGDS